MWGSSVYIGFWHVKKLFYLIKILKFFYIGKSNSYSLLNIIVCIFV